MSALINPPPPTPSPPRLAPLGLKCNASCSSASLLFFFFSLSVSSVEDKQKVVTLTHIPRYLPEITVGAHEYDKLHAAYKSVSSVKPSERLLEPEILELPLVDRLCMDG